MSDKKINLNISNADNIRTTDTSLNVTLEQSHPAEQGHANRDERLFRLQNQVRNPSVNTSFQNTTQTSRPHRQMREGFWIDNWSRENMPAGRSRQDDHSQITIPGQQERAIPDNFARPAATLTASLDTGAPSPNLRRQIPEYMSFGGENSPRRKPDEPTEGSPDLLKALEANRPSSHSSGTPVKEENKSNRSLGSDRKYTRLTRMEQHANFDKYRSMVNMGSVIGPQAVPGEKEYIARLFGEGRSEDPTYLHLRNIASQMSLGTFVPSSDSFTSSREQMDSPTSAQGTTSLNGGRNQHFFSNEQTKSIIKSLRAQGIHSVEDGIARIEKMRQFISKMKLEQIQLVLAFFYPPENAGMYDRDSDESIEAIREFYRITNELDMSAQSVLIACLFTERDMAYGTQNGIFSVDLTDLRRMLTELLVEGERLSNEQNTHIQELFIQGPEGFDPSSEL